MTPVEAADALCLAIDQRQPTSRDTAQDAQLKREYEALEAHCLATWPYEDDEGMAVFLSRWRAKTGL